MGVRLPYVCACRKKKKDRKKDRKTERKKKGMAQQLNSRWQRGGGGGGGGGGVGGGGGGGSDSGRKSPHEGNNAWRNVEAGSSMGGGERRSRGQRQHSRGNLNAGVPRRGWGMARTWSAAVVAKGWPNLDRESGFRNMRREGAAGGDRMLRHFRQLERCSWRQGVQGGGTKYAKAGRADPPPGGVVDGGSTAAQAFDGDWYEWLLRPRESKKLQTLPDADPAAACVLSSSKDDAVKKDAPDKKRLPHGPQDALSTFSQMSRRTTRTASSSSFRACGLKCAVKTNKVGRKEGRRKRVAMISIVHFG